MFDIDFDQIEEDLNKAEEYLSFAPTPKTGTLRQSSNNGNIFFYDKEFENDHQGTNKFSESMADTIIFTAPVDPAIRSVDYSNSEPYYKHAPTATHNGPETHSGDYDDDEEDSLPRNDIPVAYPTSKADPYRSNQQSSMPTKPKARPISLERIQELHQSRVVRQQNLLKERRAMDELALAECTFKPQISKGTRVILNQKAQFEQLDQDCRTMTGDHNSALNARAQEISEVEVSDRLYKEAAVRSAQHRWVQQEVEKARQMQYTFQPMLNPRNSSGPSHGHPEDRRPIHERIADMQKEKRQYLQALKASVEQAQGDLTFQPKIDARSRKIAEQKLLGYGGNPNLSPGRASTTTQPPSSGSSSSAAVPPQPPRGLGRPQLHSGGNSNAPGAVMSGEAQAALVLGFHTDVGSRLMDQGKQAAQRKQQLLHARENELAEAMQPATLCPGSERLVQRKAGLQGSFADRQVRYQSREKQRREAALREQEQQTSSWFRPHIDAHSEQIVQESRPEVLLENAAQRTERLAVADALEKEERRRRKVAEVYGAYTFTPAIDSESRARGHSSSIEELVQNRKAVEARERIRQRLEEERAHACTFQPQINELSRQLADPSAEDAFLANYARDYAPIGWAESGCPLDRSMDVDAALRQNLQRARTGRINMQEPERMARDIRAHQLEKEEHRRAELMVQEIEQLRDCTFQPSLEHSLASLERQRRDTSPVVIRGLGRYLELKHLSAKQKEDAAEREREVFSVKNVDRFRRPEDGSTMVQSFSFHLTEPKQHSRLDLSRSGEEVCPGSLNTSSVLSLAQRSHRHATSPQAAAAWCV